MKYPDFTTFELEALAKEWCTNWGGEKDDYEKVVELIDKPQKRRYHGLWRQFTDWLGDFSEEEIKMYRML